MGGKHSSGILVAVGLVLGCAVGNVAAFSEGYILTSAYSGTETVLLDSLGSVAFKWDHTALPNPKCGYSCYLLKNGNLLRSAIVPDNTVPQVYAPAQGIVQEIDPAGKPVWTFTYANKDSGMAHHDIKPMSNGHFLAVVYVPLSKTQMIAAGIDTILLKGMTGTKFILSEKIIEVDPAAPNGPAIVWEWKLHDHVIPEAQAADHPELVNGSIIKAPFFTNQWVHLNGLDYNEELDMILFSSRVFSELYIIDHGTTTQEAAGHSGGARNRGGDILYRWGNPANYKATGATTLNVLHCVNWIPKGYPGAGNIIFFHNNSAASTGPAAPRQLSQVIEIKPPLEQTGTFSKPSGQPYGPVEPTWLFAPADSFFSSFAMSSAFRLPNGNTIAHLAYPSGNGSTGGMSGNSSMIAEIGPDKNILWKYTIELKSDAGGAMTAFNPAKIMYYTKDDIRVKTLLGAASAAHRRTPVAAVVPGGIQQFGGAVRFSGVNGCVIRLYTILGREAVSVRPSGDRYDLPTVQLPPGRYLAEVTIENRIARHVAINITK
jgi:hypothetical protein